MSASSEMPYFIKPSINLSVEKKHKALQQACNEIKLYLENEDNVILKMATINCMLKTHLPYAYWVGFYIYENGRLHVGPYQGTLGCLFIELGRGVCGKAAQDRTTQIVPNVHQLEQGKGHIDCDPNSMSEIVLPVFDEDQNLIAVLDIDSTLAHSFDEIDQQYLEKMLRKVFS